MPTIKIVDFTSAQSWAILPSKIAFESRGQNVTWHQRVTSVCVLETSLTSLSSSSIISYSELLQDLAKLFGSESLDIFLIDSFRSRANTRNVSFRISLQWPIHIINPVDKTKLSYDTPTDAAPQFLYKLTRFNHTNACSTVSISLGPVVKVDQPNQLKRLFPNTYLLP